MTTNTKPTFPQSTPRLEFPQAFQARHNGRTYAVAGHPGDTSPGIGSVSPTEDAVIVWRTQDYGQTWEPFGAWVLNKFDGWSLKLFEEAKRNDT